MQRFLIGWRQKCHQQNIPSMMLKVSSSFEFAKCAQLVYDYVNFANVGALKTYRLTLKRLPKDGEPEQRLKRSQQQRVRTSGLVLLCIFCLFFGKSFLLCAGASTIYRPYQIDFMFHGSADSTLHEFKKIACPQDIYSGDETSGFILPFSHQSGSFQRDSQQSLHMLESNWTIAKAS